MIGRLRGTVAAVEGERIVLDVGGVGYEVRMTPRDLSALPGVGSEVVLHTHQHVREDSLDLYGFMGAGDRETFRLLLSASGVGPRVALAIMATFRADELRRAIASEDAATLTAVPGIGKRSAQKLILELGPKLVGTETDVSSGSGLVRVREALEGLGYAAPEIQEAMKVVPADVPVEEQVRRALQELGRR